MLDKLNDEQLYAVKKNIEGKLAVIAGAGSGKSSTLVSRVSYMLDLGIKPECILVSTFTKKASLNVIDRLKKSHGVIGSKVGVGTLHSTCYKILFHFYKTYGISDSISLASQFDLERVIKRLADRRINGGYMAIRHVDSIILWISNRKLNLVSLEDFEKQCAVELSEPLLSVVNNEKLALLEYYRAYEEHLRSNGKIDFSDMLFQTYKILVNPKFSVFTEKVISKIGYLLIDEVQDTNLLSYELYKILSSKTGNVFAVGDVRQCIYGFQSSSNEHFMDFMNKPDTDVATLTYNYRCSANIVDASNKLISTNNSLGNLPQAVAKRPYGDPIEVFVNENETEDAECIANKILELVSSGDRQFKEICVLFRVNSQGTHVVNALMQNDIPFYAPPQFNFFQRKDIKLMVSLVKAFSNPSSLTRSDMYSVLNFPNRWVKYADFKSIADRYQGSMMDMLSDISVLTNDEKLIDSFSDAYLMIKANNRSDRTTEQTINMIKDLTFADKENPFAVAFTEETEDADTTQDVNTTLEVLLSIARDIPDTKNFIYLAESMAKKKFESSGDANKVMLQTVHSSKGLEYPVVMLSGFCSRFYPFYRCETEEDYEEELRLAYVGMTRAEDNLFIFTIDGQYGRYKVRPSHYIYDAGIKSSEFRSGQEIL